MIAQKVLSALVFLISIGIVERSLAQPPRGNNTPDFKLVKLFDLKKGGGDVFNFCSVSRELFFSCYEENNRIVYRWNVDTGRKLDSYKFPRNYRSENAAVSPDGKVLLLVAYDMRPDRLQSADKVQIIDVQRGKVIKELIYEGTPARVEFSRDGKFILTRKDIHGSEGALIYDLHGTPQKNISMETFGSIETPVVWEVSNAKGGPRPGLFFRNADGKEHRLYPSDDAPWSNLSDFVVSADRHYVACSTGKGKLMIWRLPDCKVVFDSQIGKTSFHVAYDPKGGRFLFSNDYFEKTTWLRAVELATPK